MSGQRVLAPGGELLIHPDGRALLAEAGQPLCCGAGVCCVPDSGCPDNFICIAAANEQECMEAGGRWMPTDCGTKCKSIVPCCYTLDTCLGALSFCDEMTVQDCGERNGTWLPPCSSCPTNCDADFANWGLLEVPGWNYGTLQEHYVGTVFNDWCANGTCDCGASRAEYLEDTPTHMLGLNNIVVTPPGIRLLTPEQQAKLLNLPGAPNVQIPQLVFQTPSGPKCYTPQAGKGLLRYTFGGNCFMLRYDAYTHVQVTFYSNDIINAVWTPTRNCNDPGCPPGFVPINYQYRPGGALSVNYALKPQPTPTWQQYLERHLIEASHISITMEISGGPIPPAHWPPGAKFDFLVANATKRVCVMSVSPPPFMRGYKNFGDRAEWRTMRLRVRFPISLAWNSVYKWFEYTPDTLYTRGYILENLPLPCPPPLTHGFYVYPHHMTPPGAPVTSTKIIVSPTTNISSETCL